MWSPWTHLTGQGDWLYDQCEVLDRCDAEEHVTVTVRVSPETEEPLLRRFPDTQRLAA
jgi:hypothetical protein